MIITIIDKFKTLDFEGEKMRKIQNIMIVILLLISILLPIVNANSSDQSLQNNNIKNTLFGNGDRLPIVQKFIDFLKGIKIINNTINFFKNLLGIVDEIPDEPEDDSIYQPFYESDEKDPTKATPTDSSISVDIKNFEITYTTTDDTFEFDLSFNGQTTGDVYVCYWTIVTYFDDGTNSYYDLWNGPTNEGIDFMKNTFQSTFAGTGPAGERDWSSFEGRQYIKGNIEDQDEVPYEPDEYTIEKYPVDAKLFVRAFSDSELTKWNQDSRSIFDDLYGTINYDSEDDEDDDNEGDITGILIIVALIVVALIVVVFIMRKKGKI